jgi:hypothetical protein
MNNTTKVKILAEDKVKLTQDQKNLIELAFVKQIPPEDGKFIKKVQNEAQTEGKSFVKLGEYFTAKYGVYFGMIYLSAIMGGREKYEATIKSVERLRALERIEKQKKN